jgi:hypothetical protein
MTPSQIKARGRISKQEVLRKTKKIFHTLAHLDQVT